MILNQNQQSDAQLIGDIQNNKVGIDTNNLDFITSLLTTNLYSQPIQSFIRETVANGWDSHVEAGTTDKPVIVRIFKDDKGKVHIAVRDYGTGLSPERFNEVYLNVGSSTKRLSNNYIGMFGIGRFSALSVSNIVYLTNYYNGICNKFLMYKDAGKICIDKIFESATTEDNGLEVEVNTERNEYSVYDKIVLGIQNLTFYNNVYVDDPENVLSSDNMKSFNNRKIKEFRTFKVCNQDGISNSLLMGNVLYPINSGIISKWFPGIDNLPIAIKCNIGDVDITPSRETLLYSQKTIDTIDRICKETLDEIKEICNTNFKSNFRTIEDYFQFVENGYAYISLAQFDDNCNVHISIPSSSFSDYGLSDRITVDEKIPPKDILKHWRNFRYINFTGSLILYTCYNERFYIKDNKLSVCRFMEAIDNKQVYLIDEPLKPITKKYWHSINTSWRAIYFVYKKNIYRTFRQIIRSYCVTYKTTPSDENLKFILNNFLKYYSNLPSFNNTDVPQEFIEADKAAKKNNRTTVQQKARKCVIYKLIEGRSYNTVGYDTDSYTLDKLRCFKGTVFFAEKGDTYLEAFWQFCNRACCYLSNNVLFVSVAPTNLQYLRELKNAIEFNTVFVNKNNIISKLCTYAYLIEKWGLGYQILHFSQQDRKISMYNELDILLSRLQQINFYIDRYSPSNFPELLKILCTTYYKNNWLNYRIITLIESNIDYIKINNFFKENGTDCRDIVLALYEYITKNNIANQERFTRIKNTLKPLLNEYTPNSELPHFNIG